MTPTTGAPAAMKPAMKPILILAAAAGVSATAVAALTLDLSTPAAPAQPAAVRVAQAAPVAAPGPTADPAAPASDATPRQAQLISDAPVPPSGHTTRIQPIPGRAGPYLAARLAASRNDFAVAADYFRAAVAHDRTDLFLQDGALVSMVSAGQMDDAATMAQGLVDGGRTTELAGLVTRAALARKGDWAGVLAMLEKMPSTPGGAGPLMDGMTRAWAEMGDGRASDAFATFQKLERQRGAAGIARFQLALAKASVGDYEGAEAALADPESARHLMGIVARVQVLSQLERNADAVKLLDDLDALESEPALKLLRDRLAAGEKLPFDVIKSPAEGLAQVFVTFGGALMGGEDTDPLALIYARIGQYLAPDMAEAQLLVAQLLQSAGQFDLAETEFQGLRAKGDLRPAAELARIDALARADRRADAEAAARALTETWPELPSAWVALGDLLRQQDKFAEAVPVYDRALELLAKETDPQASWFALYARGIALERSGQFDRADADFQAALKLQPEQAPILNYLGYSWVDRNVRLDEGLDLIKKAVALRPDDGYILDSLAWAYYRLGRYQDAVEPMEKAVSAMSDDSLVNDHMGDIYWMVGRKREAEIQWKRALSLWKPADTDTDLNRVRAKLERGLDEVLAAEKANGGKLPEGWGQPEPAPEAAPEPAAAPADAAPVDTAPEPDTPAPPGADDGEPVPPRP